jgi:hypothetical protein
MGESLGCVYEHRLDGQGLAVYAAVAAGFTAGALLLTAMEDRESIVHRR